MGRDVTANSSAQASLTAERWIGHSTNLVGLPTDFLASRDFNDHPRPIAISGVREFNPALFDMLGEAESLAEAAGAFTLYMNAMFGIDPEQKEEPAPGRPRRFRSSWLTLLRGWGFNSNGPEGAVMKGWAESRFGLLPTFHKQPIRRISSAGWTTYVEEKMSSRFHNNSILTQLDLLFEFCQWALARCRRAARRRARAMSRCIAASMRWRSHLFCESAGAAKRASASTISFPSVRIARSPAVSATPSSPSARLWPRSSSSTSCCRPIRSRGKGSSC